MFPYGASFILIIMVILTEVQIDGSIWVLIAHRNKDKLIAYGYTLSIATKNMEHQHKIIAEIPTQYKHFTECTPNEYMALKPME